MNPWEDLLEFEVALRVLCTYIFCRTFIECDGNALSQRNSDFS